MKEKISNIATLCETRRTLRENSTPQEIMLWSRLKNKQLGYKFRRQHSFGKYIVDFYCREKSLIIQLDGSQHMEQKNYDSQRTAFFETKGLRVMRFWNNEVNTNIRGVLMKIQELLNAPPPTSPSKEREEK
jgi:very-short-patch-repair endonuclease